MGVQRESEVSRSWSIGETIGAAAESENVRAEIRERLNGIGTQIETLLDRIMKGKSETLVASYERRVEKLEREKLLVNEKLGAHVNLRRSDDLARKQAVMKMLFAERPAYKKENRRSNPDSCQPCQGDSGNLKR